jgi:hypothetical protein
MASNGLVVHGPAFAVELRRDPTHPIERRGGVDRINPMLERYLLGRRRHWAIIQAGAIETQQVCLEAQWQLAVFSFDQGQALLTAHGTLQLFF